MTTTDATAKIDPHTVLADKLGITRDAAKLINLTNSFQVRSLVIERGTAFSILRCYHIASIWFDTWGAAKAAKWSWLTQDQPLDERVAINTIKKFLPESRSIYEHHPLENKIDIRKRITTAQAIITKATDDKVLPEIELLLRPIAYILEHEGHKIWQ